MARLAITTQLLLSAIWHTRLPIFSFLAMMKFEKDDYFSAQLFTHELLHAFRSDHILASNAQLEYDPTLSGFEESFAQVQWFMRSLISL